MEVQFQYIVRLAKQYKTYSDQQQLLFDALNELPRLVVEEIYKEYGDPDNAFQPVNVLRAEIARKILSGIQLTESLVEEIKNKIRVKDTAYFAHLSSSLISQLVEYPITKRDLFANWQRHWPVFHTFIYRGEVLDTTRLYLEQICNQLAKDLAVPDYDYHWVDFYGSSNFGSDWCWLALFPAHKETHQAAYQFFAELSHEPKAGIRAGKNLKEHIDLGRVNSYQELVEGLESKKADVVKLNARLKNYFKFAPGSQASEWEDFKNKGIAAVSYLEFDLGDLNSFSSREQMNIASGAPADSQSNQLWNLWLFKTANIGDIVFANKGVNTCIGIGIIDGDYYFDPAGPYQHRRKVNWITDKVYQYKGNLKGYKTIFRPDTFSPTKVWQFLLNEYVKTYPELMDLFDKHDLKYEPRTYSSKQEEKIPIVEDSDETDEAVPIKDEINFWWLNANPNIWSISSFAEGDRQKYTTHNEKGNKRRIYKYFQAVKPGDLMIGYESSPVKQIKAIYEITKGIHSTGEQEEIEFMLVEKLEVPVDWNDLKNNNSLQDCEVFANNQGSLFKLTEDEFDVIREIIDTKNLIVEEVKSKGIRYNFKDDPDKPFIAEDEFRRAIALLKRKKNIILQGPPGVGKTFIAKKLAYEIMGEEKEFNIETVQFHQSYSYEDFIQGLRPTTKGFELKDGVFHTFCRRALAHPERPFFFIIDEINRGNLSKIFGELLMLIESDKRSIKHRIKLTYAEDNDDLFYVPDNLYIIGTMNTADRSLAIVDYALRRRFAFITLQPDYGNAFRNFLGNCGVSGRLVNHLCKSVSLVNTQIKNDKNLGEGFQIGHSYFCTYNRLSDEETWWNEVLSFEIKPLLEEIWFDDQGKVNDMIQVLSNTDANTD